MKTGPKPRLKSRDMFVIEQHMAIDGMSVQEMADHLGLTRQGIYNTLNRQVVKKEIEKRQKLEAEYLAEAKKREVKRAQRMLSKGLKRIEVIIDKGSDQNFLGAFRMFLQWIGQLDSGMTVKVENNITLSERIDSAKQYSVEVDRMKALNGN